jgi:hypothetical protein
MRRDRQDGINETTDVRFDTRDDMPRFNFLQLVMFTKFTSRVDFLSMAYLSGLSLPLHGEPMERMFIYELGFCKFPSRGDRMNADVVDIYEA